MKKYMVIECMVDSSPYMEKDYITLTFIREAKDTCEIYRDLKAMLGPHIMSFRWRYATWRERRVHERNLKMPKGYIF